MTATASASARSDIVAAPPLPVTPFRRLFGPGEGYDYTRIPVLSALHDGTLLAAVEARRGGGGDWAETHLLMRRSADRGDSWSDPARVCVTPADGRPHSVPTEHSDAKRTGDYFVHGNLCLMPVQGGEVHALFVFEYHRVFHRRSRDGGATWSAPVEVTAALAALKARYPWRVCATGPGGAVRLRSGRLLAPVWLSLSSGGHGHRPSVVTTLISDDDGATWRHGDLVAVDGDHAADGRRIENPNESALVELADGRVLIDMRTESPANRRLHAVSGDGGETFSHPRFVDDLVDCVCETSVVRDGDRLYSSSPDPRDGGDLGGYGWGRSLPRRRLVLRASSDGGQRWRTLGAIDPGTVGYSHLAIAHDRLWCLYERADGKGWADHVGTVSIALSELRRR
jgi:sialidase-1